MLSKAQLLYSLFLISMNVSGLEFFWYFLIQKTGPLLLQTHPFFGILGALCCIFIFQIYLSILPANFDTIFSIGDMSQWMMSTYNQVAGGIYDLAQRHVITSSYSSYPYTVGWYNRVGSPEDPTMLLYGAWDAFNRVLYSLFNFLRFHVWFLAWKRVLDGM